MSQGVADSVGARRRWWPGLDLAEQTPAGGLVRVGPAAQPARPSSVSVGRGDGEGAVAGPGVSGGLVVPAPNEDRAGWELFGRLVGRLRSGRAPRGGAGSAPVRGRRPGGAQRPGRSLGEVLAGRDRTDAGWFHHGVEGYGVAQRPPHPWFFLPRVLRVGIRAGIAGGVGAGAVWGAVAPEAAAAAVSSAGSVGVPLVLAWLGWCVAHGAALARHRRQWVRPAAEALVELLGYPHHHPTRRWLHVPLDFQESGGSPVTLILPHDFTGEPERQQALMGALRTVLSLAGTKETWHLSGRQHRLEVRTDRKHLATKVPWSRDVVQLIDDTPPGSKFLGVDADGKPHYWNHGSEFPHFGLCAESGGGKSTLLELVAAQALRDGEIVVAVDIKQHSLGFLLPLENTTENLHYWRTPQEISQGMQWLIGELTARNAAVTAALKARKTPPKFQGVTLLFDEVNSAMREVRNWWKAVREPADPATPPAIAHTLTFLQAGRAVRMHGFVCTQYGTAKGLGDTTGEVREGLGGRGVIKSGAKAWKLWAPEVLNPPPKSDIAGRLWLVYGARTVETQIPFAAAEDLEKLAATPRPGQQLPAFDKAADLPEQQVTVTDDQDDEPVVDAAEMVTLTQASTDRGEGLIDRTHAALKQARYRAKKHGQGGFPAPVGKDGAAELFDLAELQAWDQPGSEDTDKELAQA